MLELLQIASCALKYADFLPKASDLISRMMNQEVKGTTFLEQISKATLNYPYNFHKGNPETHESINTDLVHGI